MTLTKVDRNACPVFPAGVIKKIRRSNCTSATYSPTHGLANWQSSGRVDNKQNDKPEIKLHALCHWLASRWWMHQNNRARTHGK